MPRSGWQMRGVPWVESVADHSFGVVFVALALADALEEEGRGRLPRTGLDVKKVLVMALLHDLAEVRLTDLPASATRLISEEVKSRAEERVIDDLLAPLRSTGRWKTLWQEFKDCASPESRLVSDADKLEMMVQCLRYEQAGSHGLDEFWEAMDQRVWHYPLCSELYACLRGLRPEWAR
jgi:putative hydrolase of HD superfamily